MSLLFPMAVLAPAWFVVAQGSAQEPSTESRPAETPASVRLVLPSCPLNSIDIPDFVELVRIEMVALGVTSLALGDASAEPTDDPVAIITLIVEPCEAAALELQVTIADTLTAKHVERHFDLSDVDLVSRPRTLALGVAELLRASWTELVLPDAPGATVVVPGRVRQAILVRLRSTIEALPAGRPPTRSRASMEPPRVPLLDAHLAVLAFAGSQTSLLGGGVGFSFSLVRPLRLDLAGVLAFGSVFDRLGTVDVGFAATRVALTIATETRTLGFALGPRIDVGWAWSQGHSYDPATRAGKGGAVVVLGGLGACLRFRLAGAWWGSVALDAGGTLAALEARVDDRTVAGVVGPWLAVRTGVAFAID